jgi:uncharacterized protein (TIGR03437 family)
VNQSITTGQAAPSVEPLARTTAMPTVTIGGVQVNPGYAGLAPGFVGLYQVNVVMPSGVNAGTAAVQINSGGMNSNTAQMAVGR